MDYRPLYIIDQSGKCIIDQWYTENTQKFTILLLLRMFLCILFVRGFVCL